MEEKKTDYKLTKKKNTRFKNVNSRLIKEERHMALMAVFI